MAWFFIRFQLPSFRWESVAQSGDKRGTWAVDETPILALLTPLFWRLDLKINEQRAVWFVLSQSTPGSTLPRFLPIPAGLKPVIFDSSLPLTSRSLSKVGFPLSSIIHCFTDVSLVFQGPGHPAALQLERQSSMQIDLTDRNQCILSCRGKIVAQEPLSAPFI